MKKFLELSKRYEALKEEMKTVKEELTTEMVLLGAGKHFQDEETKLVYEIVEPTGTYVEFKKLDYNRTKKAEETKGSLSAKRATELGYTL